MLMPLYMTFMVIYISWLKNKFLLNNSKLLDYPVLYGLLLLYYISKRCYPNSYMTKMVNVCALYDLPTGIFKVSLTNNFKNKDFTYPFYALLRKRPINVNLR